jgi:hypothetical protein
MEAKTIRIQGPNFVAAVDLESTNGVETVTLTAPMLRYMKGWTLNRVMRYCKGKKWPAEILNTDETFH